MGFTLADISVYDALVNWAEHMLPGILARFPTLRLYTERVASRPGIAAWLSSEIRREIGKEDGEDEKPRWKLTAHGVKPNRKPRATTSKSRTKKVRKIVVKKR